jgi:hypothetical protein
MFCKKNICFTMVFESDQTVWDIPTNLRFHKISTFEKRCTVGYCNSLFGAAEFQITLVFCGCECDMSFRIANRICKWQNERLAYTKRMVSERNPTVDPSNTLYGRTNHFLKHEILIFSICWRWRVRGSVLRIVTLTEQICTCHFVL